MLQANAMKEKVGYPDEIMEAEYINKLYENVRTYIKVCITNDSVFQLLTFTHQYCG